MSGDPDRPSSDRALLLPGVGAAMRGAAGAAQVLSVIGNQGVNSISNFAVTVFLVRVLGLEGFGVFALYFLLGNGLANIAHALVNLPLASTGGSMDDTAQRATIAAAARLQLEGLGAAFLVAVVADLVAAQFGIRGLPSLTLFLMLTALVAAEASRRMLFLTGRNATVWWFDLGRLSLLALVFVALAGIGRSSAIAFVVGFAVANIVATVVLASAMGMWGTFFRRPAGYTGAARRLLRSGKWLALGTVLDVVNANIVLIVAGAVLGTSAVGIIRSCQTLLGLANTFLLGMEHIVPRSIGRWQRLHGDDTATRHYWMVTGFALAAFALGLAVVAAFAGALLTISFGAVTAAQAWVLQALCVAQWFSTCQRFINFRFRSIEHTFPIFATSALTAVLSGIVCLPLIAWLELQGAVIAIVLLSAASLIISIILLTRPRAISSMPVGERPSVSE